MTPLRCSLRRDYLNIYPLPVCFVDNTVLDSAMNPVGELSVELSGPLPFLRPEVAQVFDGNHGIVFLGNLNYSLRYMGYPVVNANNSSPQSSYLLTGSLTLRQPRLKIVNASPQVSNFIKQPAILNEFNVADFTVFMQNYNSLIPQSDINTNYLLRWLNLNLLLNRYNKVEPSTPSNKLNSPKLVFSIKSILKQSTLVFSTLDWDYNPVILLPINLNLEEKRKLLTLPNYATNTRDVHANSEAINLRQRGFMFDFTIKPLLIQFSPRVKNFHNNISDFLHSLASNIERLSNLLVKFLMQNVLKVFSSNLVDELFVQRVFKNIRVVKPLLLGIDCKSL